MPLEISYQNSYLSSKMWDKIPKNSLFFAPMEGITDETYRVATESLYPSWNFFASDFLRVPSNGQYSDKKILNHFGHKIFLNEHLRNKNYLQFLISTHSNILPFLKSVNTIGFSWIDLNLGCPSKSVNKHFGGSYLLKELTFLKETLPIIREHFQGHLTAKIRIGYEDDILFLEIIELLQKCGIELITVHGRTKEQMYKGKANWKYLKSAVENSSVPIIGNGDVWSLEDIDALFDYANCHGIMCARGALKTPWLSEIYKDFQGKGHQLSEDFFIDLAYENIPIYLEKIIKVYEEKSDKYIISRLKSLSRFLFDPLPSGQEIKSRFLRSQTLDELIQIIHHL